MTIEGLRPLLQVFDMPTAVGFYCDVLGFGVLSRSPTYATQAGVELFHWALLKSGDAELMLNTAYDEGERPAVRDRQRQSAHGDTELYFDCPDLDEAYAHLKTHGVPCIEPRVAPYGMRQLSFADPDGYGITLQHRV